MEELYLPRVFTQMRPPLEQPIDTGRVAVVGGWPAKGLRIG